MRVLMTVLFLGIASFAVADEKAIALGEKIPDFTKLPTADGKEVSLGDFAQDVLVVIVTCNECPVARSYEARFVDFATKHAGASKKVGILAINPYDRPGDNLEDMKTRAEEAKFPFPYAQDKEQAFTKRLGAEKTPHVFVFNKERALVYKGAFDDSWVDPQAVKKSYLEDVVSALAAGSAIASPTTKAEGCPIHFD